MLRRALVSCSLVLIAAALRPAPARAISSRLLISPIGAASGDGFGLPVASAGDVNGDGYDDVIVGAPNNDAGGSNAGRAYIFFGGPGEHATPDVILTGAAAGDNFGFSVASAGDVNGDGYADVIVGAIANDAGGTDAGRAYVYFGGPVPHTFPDLTLTGAAAGDNFGVSVASAGDVNGDGYADVIVGAWLNSAGGAAAGRAYVYYGGPSPDAVADLTLTGAAAGDEFGFSVASAGDVNGDGYADIIVGAQNNDAGGSNAGRAYVYYGGPAADATADLILTGAAAGDSFGYSVASAGDVNGDGYADVVVGAPFNGSGGSLAGRAYVYYGGPSADAVADLTLTGAAAGDELGLSAASAGDVNGDGFSDVIVGGFRNDVGGVDAGRAYVYFGGPTADATADLVFTGQVAGDQYGVSVASAGNFSGDGYDDVIVGANGNDAGGSAAGRAYVTGIYPYQVLSPNGGETWVAGTQATVHWRGHDVADLAYSGDGGVSWSTLASGIGGSDDNVFTVTAPATPSVTAKIRLSYSGQSVAHATSDASDRVFRVVAPSTPPQAANRLELTATGATLLEELGLSVASAGDVNGDGFADLIVGVPFNDAGGTDAGRAYIYFGGPAADGTPDVVLTGAAAGDQFGHSVAPAGDVNGDGYADVIVGAPFNDAGGTDAGRAYVFFGGPAMDTTPDLTLTGAAAGDLFGYSVASAGDVNHDGFADVIAGAPDNDAGGSNAGRAYVYFGGPAADTTPDLTLTGSAVGDELGWAVASAGDVNGDGFADVIVGVPFSDAGGVDAGRANVYFGGPAPDATPDLVLTGQTAGDEFGFAVASAGDVNGDGFADLVVGAPLYDAGGGVATNAGRAYVFYGGPSADASADLTITGTTAYDNLGNSVAGAGDVNGDGFADVLIGAYQTDAPGPQAGSALIVYGGPAPDATPDLVLTGATGDGFGYSVASAGDVNGDGFPDIVVGAPYNSAAALDAGRAYLYDMKRYQITAPNGGETWNVGAVKTISWLGAEPADVWLSVDGGATQTLLESGVGGAATNSLPIRVPHLPTKFARVRVTPADVSLSGSDRSDSLFTIQSSVSLLLFEASRDANGVNLSWSSDPAVGPAGILGYRLYRIASGSEGADGTRIGGDLLTATRFTDAGGAPGSTYRLAAVNGLEEELELGRVTVGAPLRGMKVWPSPVAIGGSGSAGGSLASGPVHVAFAAPAGPSGAPATDLDVAVYDIGGRRVAELARGVVAASGGIINLTWDGRASSGTAVAPGTYILRAAAPSASFTVSRKFMVVR